MKQAGRKSGRLSEALKAPDGPANIDWDEIRRKYKARLDDEIARGVDNAETRARQAELNQPVPSTPLPYQRKSRAKPKSEHVGRGKKPRIPRARMKELWLDEGKTIAEVAAELGCSSDTVRMYVRTQPWFDKTRDRHKMKKGGRPPRTHCPRGHEYAVYGKPTPQKKPDGTPRGRYCTECKRQSERKS